MKRVKINWRKLVDVRQWLMNWDNIETDQVAGFRINKDHLKRVLEARNLPVDQKLAKVWVRNFEN